MEGRPQSFELTRFELRLDPFKQHDVALWYPVLVEARPFGGSRGLASTIKTFVVFPHGKRMEGCPQSSELTRFELRLVPFKHMALLSVPVLIVEAGQAVVLLPPSRPS